MFRNARLTLIRSFHVDTARRFAYENIQSSTFQMKFMPTRKLSLQPLASCNSSCSIFGELFELVLLTSCENNSSSHDFPFDVGLWSLWLVYIYIHIYSYAMILTNLISILFHIPHIYLADQVMNQNRFHYYIGIDDATCFTFTRLKIHLVISARFLK